MKLRLIGLLIMATIAIAPIADAVERMSNKTPVGSMLKSAEWERVPLALRESAQFSAGVESVRVMHRVQKNLQRVLDHSRDEHGVRMDRSKFIAELGRIATQEGLAPADKALRGTIQDITSERRGELIYETQMEMAHGFANWKSGQDPDALEAFPAQEFLRIEARKEERDWGQTANGRWLAAARQVGDHEAVRVWGETNRMVALKSSNIWVALSRFGTPWPPFDFNSGMGVEDVSRSEALALGLLRSSAPAAPLRQAEFTDGLKASKGSVPEKEWQQLKHAFGDQVRISGDEIRWHGNLIQELHDRAISEPDFKSSSRLGRATPRTVAMARKAGADLSGAELRLTADDIRHASDRHGASESRPGQQPLTRLDYEMLPHVWRSPDAVVKGDRPDSWIFRKELDGHLYSVVWRRTGGEKKTFGIKTLWKARPDRAGA